MATGLNPDHFRLLVVRPTLRILESAEIPYSLQAENLLMGTAAAESSFRHLEQLSRGGALGLYQIEAGTHQDLWENYLPRKKRIERVLVGLISFRNANWRPPPNEELIYNLRYATAIARLVYWRRPEPLPDPLNIKALGRYWKKYFNSRLGKGNMAHFAAQWAALIGDEMGTLKPEAVEENEPIQSEVTF